MSARIWAGIDAGIDNVVSLAAVDGDEQAVRIGQSIREAAVEHGVEVVDQNEIWRQLIAAGIV